MTPPAGCFYVVIVKDIKSDIRALTGIRGLAACMVVLYHYFHDSAGFGILHTVIKHSYIAVDLFFVLSGYVMALTYGPTFSGGFRLGSYGSFLGKRLGRVYPLYIIVTVLAGIFLYFHIMKGDAPSVFTMVANGLMIQAWGVAGSMDAPTWSISTEFAAYVVFPLLVAGVLVGRYRGLMAAGCAALILGVLAATDTHTLKQFYGGVSSRSGPLDIFGTGTLYPLLRCFAGFILGLAAYRFAALWVKVRAAGSMLGGDIAAAAVVILWAIRGTDVFLELAFVPLVITLATGDSYTARFAGSRPVFWLGEISYSIYLVHYLLESVLRTPLKLALASHHVPHAFTISGFLPLLLTFFVSAMTYYGIERPARNWSRKLIGSRRSPPIYMEPAAP